MYLLSARRREARHIQHTSIPAGATTLGGAALARSPPLGRSIMDVNSTQTQQGCSKDELVFFSNRVKWLVLRVDALLVLNAVLMGIIVVIDNYGHRYRHHPLTRFLYLGAITLFLPIVSYVVSTVTDTFIVYSMKDRTITGNCNHAPSHGVLVFLWFGLLQLVATNSTAIVAGDAREGRSIAPPTVQFVQATCIFYLVAFSAFSDMDPSGHVKLSREVVLSTQELLFLVSLGVLILAKSLLKYYAWYKARQSLALGRNPRLIVGYMKQLQEQADGIHHAGLVSEHVPPPPPPLIVTREDTILVEKQPHGYSLPGINNNNDLVTIDKVWQFDDMLLRPTAQHKDLCFSFALFKLLRCRFARYTASEAGFMKTSNFIQHVLLEDSDDERILGVIAHELSFLHDYYYSSLPISYSESWLPTMSISISLLSIAYCFVAIWVLVANLSHLTVYPYKRQIGCSPVKCSSEYSGFQKNSEYHERNPGIHDETDISFGSLYFDLVPVYSLVLLALLVEAREIASYVYSNWTKVALICRYVKHASWQRSPTIRKCIGHVLRSRCKLLKYWEDKMNQCSILVLHPRWKKTPVALIQRLVHLPDQKKKVPRAVKAAVVDALRSYKGVTSLRRTLQLRAGGDLVWTFDGAKGTASTMLVCHIATSILEVRSSSSQRRHQQPLPDHRTVATHLSRYCAYLVAHSPELLPDDEVWCKSLYRAVKKDAERVVLGARGVTVTAGAECCQQLAELLRARSEQEVLRDGAELGMRLAELVQGEETAWEVLAGFWSHTILYVAASSDDNINEHADAVARGGELVTLLWALLAHVGIVRGSPEDAAVATAAAPVDV